MPCYLPPTIYHKVDFHASRSPSTFRPMSPSDHSPVPSTMTSYSLAISSMVAVENGVGRVLGLRGSGWWEKVENKEDWAEIGGKQPDLEQSV